MSTPIAVSPIHDALISRAAIWESHAEQVAGVARFSSKDSDKAKQAGIADLSHLVRTGVKGPGSAAWLTRQGFSLPSQPNSWLPLQDGGLVARLGGSEYLIEAQSPVISAMIQTPRDSGVFPVLRQDAAFALCGERVNELLLQVCNVDFRDLNSNPARVVLTSMAGVSVTVLRCAPEGKPCYRLWADGSFGTYLWETLCSIAEELDGGCIGLESLPL